MKKTILVLLTIVLALSCAFAKISAGTYLDVQGRTDMNYAGDENKADWTRKLYFTVKPYFCDDYFNLSLKFDFGYDSYEKDGWYSFFKSYQVEDLKFAFEPVLISYISNYIDNLTIGNDSFKIGFTRDEQLDVTTLATGKYTKISKDEYFGEPYLSSITSPELSAFVSYDFGEHSVYAFAERVDQKLEDYDETFDFYQTFGSEVIAPSFLIKGLKYRVSSFSDVFTKNDGNFLAFLYPEFGFEWNTELAGKPFTLIGAVNSCYPYAKKETVKKDVVSMGSSKLIGAKIVLGKFDVFADGYLLQDGLEKNSLGDWTDYKESVFRASDVLIEGIALGGDVEVKYNFSDNNFISFGTGCALDPKNGLKLYDIDNVNDDCGALDYAKVAAKIGTSKVWFAVDGEFDYFYSCFIPGLFSGSPNFYIILSNSGEWFKASATVGAQVGDLALEANVSTGPKTGDNPLDFYGTFKGTLKLGN